MNNHIKSAIRQIDAVQTGKADIDKLADAVMNLDLGLAELEAESKPPGVYDVVDLYEDESKPTKILFFVKMLRKSASWKLSYAKRTDKVSAKWMQQICNKALKACDIIKIQAEQLKDKHTISSEDASYLRKVSAENLDLKVKIENQAEQLKELSAQAHNASLYADERNELREQLKDVAENMELFEKRRGGECCKCGSWVCPPLTCTSCSAGQPPEGRLRKINQKLTEDNLAIVQQLAAANKEIETLKSKNTAAISTIYDQERLLDQREKEIERLKTALRSIQTWANAYPLDVFMKPDLKKAAKVLKENGMTLDAISADAMRHVLDGIKEIVEQGLKGK